MADVAHLSPHHFAREVALLVGFPDQSHFSFHFKRIVSVTPGQFVTPGRFGFPQKKRKSPQAPARTRTPSPLAC
jgi:AraC-like DNA-binding protein